MNNIVNLLRIFLAFKQRKIKLSYFPTRIWIESTNICNLNCPMCPNDSIKPEKKGFMKIDLFKKIIDEISGHTRDIYLHHRGEPLLHKDLFEMIKYAKQKGLLTKLHTNATLLTEEKSLKMLESGLDFVSFSLDSYDKETYEKIRVGANFDETFSNISTFLELKKKLRKNKPRTILQFLEVPEEKTRTEIENKIKDIFHSLPFDEIRIIPVHNWAGNVGIDQKGKCSSQNIKPCTFLWYSLTILYDGTVVPCPQDFMGELELGNVRTDSLHTIWNNEKIMQLRKKMVNGEVNELKPCNTCDRLLREKVLGSVPKQNLLTFIRENIVGYGPMNRLKKFFSSSK